ncbi:replication protein [Acinetobacter baumannii]|uniref:replication protein n=1 Tax=Acinetobacter baumannii TaxID=470 RepID=UPI000A38E5A3|nr:replication protein [Acinetobacter baumannii]OTT67869.1 replication protein [Acinetobacter baumannii]
MSKFVPNSFMVANAFVDEAMNKISDASVKIYLLIVRKTRGWTKESDALSLTQLEDLSLKSRPTVVKCLNELVKVGLIKKHHQSKYGNVYSLIDHYNIGELIKFPSKKILLVQEFTPFKNEIVKNFNYPKTVYQTSEKVGEIRLNFPSKNSLLVKSFNQTSKNFLPLLVKIFNTQSITIKNNSQSNKKINKKRESVSEKTKSEKPTVFNPRLVELPACVDPELWNNFVDMRISIKKPLSENAVKLILKKLISFGPLANQSLENSIIGNYQGVFEPRQNQIQENPQSHNVPEEPGYFTQMYAESNRSNVIDVTPVSHDFGGY